MGERPSWFDADGAGCPLADCDAYPVERVSWLDALAFCNALSSAEGLEECYELTGDHASWTWGLQCKGYRLPTEAEWEYAARAGSQSRFWNGDDDASLDAVGWYTGNSALEGTPQVQPVSGLGANPWGLFDVHGNVYEWVTNGFHEYDVAFDPMGDEPCPGCAANGFRGIRGGSFTSPAPDARSAARRFINPNDRRADCGVRLVRQL